MDERPELPAEKAFVLKLSRDTDHLLAPFAGRLEHLSTGRRVRFATVEEFLEVLIRLLSEEARA